MLHWNKLALKGGGAKGFVYIGVAQALEQKNILQNIDVIAGSSVGAIGCLLLSSGLSVEQLKRQIFNTDFESMIYDTWAITDAYTLYQYRGLHQGKKLYEWFGEFIESITGDKDTTFEQWHKIKTAHPEKKLKDMIIEACNVSISRNEVFSANSDLKHTPIRLAIRASMAIPVFFTPVKIGDYEYVDGGTQQNCPITAFNQNNQIDKQALAVWLAPKDVTENILNGERKIRWLFVTRSLD